MCVIIQKPKGIKVTEQDIRSAHRRNGDGFGYTYFDPESGRLVYDKGIDFTIEEIIEKFNELENFDALFHFRIRTHGGTTDEQCHPFIVSSKDEQQGSCDVMLTHNGMIHGMTAIGQESDTMAFNRTFLIPALTKNPELLDQEWFIALLEKYIGIGSKLCFLYHHNGETKYAFVNKKAGAMHDNCWWSNEYSFQNYSAANRSNVSSSSNLPTQRNTNVTKAANILMGELVEGKNIVVFSNSDAAFRQVAKIDFVDSYRVGCVVQLKGSTIKTQIIFDSETGYAYGKNSDYYYLSERQDTDITKMIESQEQKKSQQSTTNQKGETTVAEKTNVVPLIPTDTTTTGKTGDMVGGSNLGFLDAEDLGAILEHGGKSFDAGFLYGGGCIDPDTQYGSPNDCDDLTIEDFYHSNYKERFEFFTKKPVEAFMMLQDLSEFLMLQLGHDLYNSEVMDEPQEESKQTNVEAISQ